MFWYDFLSTAHFFVRLPLCRTFFCTISSLPHIFLYDYLSTEHFLVRFPLYRTFFRTISSLPHIFGYDYLSTAHFLDCCRRQTGKPASCAGCELCGCEPALPAFSTDAHPLQCVGAVSWFWSFVFPPLFGIDFFRKPLFPDSFQASRHKREKQRGKKQSGREYSCS